MSFFYWPALMLHALLRMLDALQASVSTRDLQMRE